MKFLSSLFLLVLVNGIRGLPRPTEFPSDDHSYDDEFSVPHENDPLPTPGPPSPSIEDEAAEPDSLAWDEDEMYHTRPQKFEDKPTCAHALKMVGKINEFRRLHGAGPLLVDLAISKEAAAWANLIRNSGKAKLNPKAKYGQDVCIAPKGDKDVPKTCATDFYKTVQFYDWAKHKLSAKNSFFAQMAWKSVQRVGVGCATGPLGRTYVVVYFDKTGSKSEEAKENVQGYIDVFTSVSGVKCDAGFTKYQGTCYKFDTEAKTWEDALKTCANHGAVLVNIKNANEEMFIKNVKVPKGKKKGDAWLALNDIATEGTYTSADGSGIEYMNWKIGEPHGKGQNCVTFNSESQFGSMADIKCTEKKQFICKKPLEGDLVFRFTIATGAKYSAEFANPYSAATKKFKKNLEEDIKEALKAIKSLKIAIVGLLVKREEKKKGKRATAKKTAAAPATTDATVYLQFGPKTPVDPATPIVEYIAKNKGKLPKLGETAKVQSVSIVPPGQEPPSLAQAIAAKAAAKAAAQSACGVPSCYGSCTPPCPSSCCGSPSGSPYGSQSPYPQQPSSYGSPYGASPAPCGQPPCPPPAYGAAPSPYGQVPQQQTPKHLTIQNVKQQKAAAAAPACGQYGQPACSPYGQVAPSYATPFAQQPSIVATPCVRSATGQCLPKPLTIRFPLVKNAKARSVCRGNNCNSPLPYQIAPAQPPFYPPPPQPFGTPYGVPYGAALSSSPYAAGYGRYGNPCLPPLNCNTKTKKGRKAKKSKKKSKAVVSSYGGSYGGGPPFAFSSFGSNQYGQQPTFAANPCGPPPMNPCAPPPMVAPQPPPFGNPCVPTPLNPCFGKRAVLPRPQQSPFGLSPFGANPCAAPPCPPPMPPMMPPMLPMMPPMLPMMPPMPPANRCAVPPCPPPMPPMIPPVNPCAAPPCPPPMPPMIPPVNPCAAPPCPPPMPPMLPRLPLPPPCAAPPCPPPMPPMLPRLPFPPRCAAPPCPPPMPPMMPPTGVAIGMMPQNPFIPNPFNPCIPSVTNPCAPSPATKKGKGKAAAKKAPKPPPAPQFQSLYGFTSPPMSLLPPPPLFGNPCAPSPFNPNPCAPKPAPKKGKSAKPKSKSKAPPRPATPLGLNPYAQPSPFGSPFNPCGLPPMNPCAPPMFPPMPPPMPPVPAFGVYPPPPFGSPFGANPCNPAFSPCPPPKPKAAPKKGKKATKKPAAPKVPQPQIIPPQYPGGPLTVQMPPMVMPVSMPANQLPFGLPPFPNPSQCAVGCLARATCPTYCSAPCCKRGRMIRAKKSQIFRRFKL